MCQYGNVIMLCSPSLSLSPLSYSDNISLNFIQKGFPAIPACRCDFMAENTNKESLLLLKEHFIQIQLWQPLREKTLVY